MEILDENSPCQYQTELKTFSATYTIHTANAEPRRSLESLPGWLVVVHPFVVLKVLQLGGSGLIKKHADPRVMLQRRGGQKGGFSGAKLAYAI